MYLLYMLLPSWPCLSWGKSDLNYTFAWINKNMYSTWKDTTLIHSSSATCSSRVESQAEQNEQGASDIPSPHPPLPALLGCLLRCFQVKKVSPACWGSSLVSPPSWICQEHHLWKHPGGFLFRSPKHLNWPPSIWRSSGSTLSLSCREFFLSFCIHNILSVST